MVDSRDILIYVAGPYTPKDGRSTDDNGFH